MRSEQLVSVVIPAWNSAATLDETLRSVRAQTHHALEIIVVDDGSTDRTPAIVTAHAAVDARVQLLQQENAGLAAARNAGWRHARANLIAFLDSDDIWAPTKIERQLDAFHSAGGQVGLVYCGSVRIDGDGAVVFLYPLAHYDGDVLQQLFTSNFIGNGSAAMLTREALIHADGFDSALRDAGGQGCEDYLLQCRVAEKYRFAVVPEHLVGYRYLPASMSNDRPQMLRGWILVVEKLTAQHPDHIAALRKGLRNYAAWITWDAVSRRAFAQLPALATVLMQYSPSVALAASIWDLPLLAVKRINSRATNLLRGQSTAQLSASSALIHQSPGDNGLTG